MPRRGRVFAWCSAAVGLVVLVVAGGVLVHWLVEQRFTMDPPKGRVLTFPSISLGELSIRDWTPIIPQPAFWQDAGEAQGELAVPSGKALMLQPYSQISDFSGLSSLHLDDIQVLSFPAQNSVTDEQMQFIAHLTSLQVLELGGSQVSDAGLRFLRRMNFLHHLDLQGCRITDKGLSYVADLKNLKTLWLFRTQVTETGIRKLQQALADCLISWQ